MKDAGVREPFLIPLSWARWSTAIFGAGLGLRETFDNISRTLLPPFCCSSLRHQDDVHPWDQLHITANIEVLGIFQVIWWKGPTLYSSFVVQLDNMHMRISHQREEELIKARNVDWLTNNLHLVIKDLAEMIFKFTTSTPMLATLA